MQGMPLPRAQVGVAAVLGTTVWSGLAGSQGGGGYVGEGLGAAARKGEDVPGKDAEVQGSEGGGGEREAGREGGAGEDVAVVAALVRVAGVEGDEKAEVVEAGDAGVEQADERRGASGGR